MQLPVEIIWMIFEWLYLQQDPVYLRLFRVCKLWLQIRTCMDEKYPIDKQAFLENIWNCPNMVPNLNANVCGYLTMHHILNVGMQHREHISYCHEFATKNNILDHALTHALKHGVVDYVLQHRDKLVVESTHSKYIFYYEIQELYDMVPVWDMLYAIRYPSASSIAYYENKSSPICEFGTASLVNMLFNGFAEPEIDRDNLQYAERVIALLRHIKTDDSVIRDYLNDNLINSTRIHRFRHVLIAITEAFGIHMLNLSDINLSIDHKINKSAWKFIRRFRYIRALQFRCIQLREAVWMTNKCCNIGISANIAAIYCHTHTK